MEFEERYHITGYELEPEVRESYTSGLKKLRDAIAHQEQLNILSGIFDSLSKSKPQRGKSLEWAEEIINAYRNLGIFVGKLKRTESEEGLETRVSAFEKTFS